MISLIRNQALWLATLSAPLLVPQVHGTPTNAGRGVDLLERSVPTYQSLNYTDVALKTESIRWYIISSKVNSSETDAEFQYQFETVHANDTLQSALAFSGQPLKQYWQGVHYRDQVNDSDMAAWDDASAPFTSWTPMPRSYQPVSLARHVWSSLDAINKSDHEQTYLNTTGQHAFALPQYLAFLTPLARLTWNKATFSFEDDPRPNNDSLIHVGLFLGDASYGASHQTIYETMEVRRAYVESVLRQKPALADGLLNFVQCGKSPLVGSKPLDVLGPLNKGTLFENSTAWQHVAAEDYFFSDAASAAAFMKNMPELKNLLWEGSSGSFAFATKVRGNMSDLKEVRRTKDKEETHGPILDNRDIASEGVLVYPSCNCGADRSNSQSILS
ncbi:hypothetical protein CCUS01_11465 [Colletotrichum cuscutae]|uniref:Uncharacterized protein n=1 Tax=Colletotrichum cuscutae TaxID=1209917 RepID=A0AAI9XIN6_9PEZI|nr:hypothetical protein CCUS01_11465 [Colletotrichum cuscutae]